MTAHLSTSKAGYFMFISYLFFFSHAPTINTTTHENTCQETFPVLALLSAQRVSLFFSAASTVYVNYEAQHGLEPSVGRVVFRRYLDRAPVKYEIFHQFRTWLRGHARELGWSLAGPSLVFLNGEKKWQQAINHHRDPDFWILHRKTSTTRSRITTERAPRTTGTTESCSPTSFFTCK